MEAARCRAEVRKSPHAGSVCHLKENHETARKGAVVPEGSITRPQSSSEYNEKQQEDMKHIRTQISNNGGNA